MRDDADTSRQTLLLAFFLAALDIDIHVVWVAPLLLKSALLFPEAAFVEALAVGHVLDEIGVQAAANSFDLHLAGPQRLLVGK